MIKKTDDLECRQVRWICGVSVMTEQGNGRNRMEVHAIQLDNQLSELGRLHGFFEELSVRESWPARIKWDLTLSCEELLTNTIHYGYPQGGRHPITLTVSMESRQIVVKLEDDGLPFNPLEQEAPDLTQDLENRAVGGLGIFLVRQRTDHMVYERTDKGNRVILYKNME